ncbi:MAG: PaeR7I family type II restriction endonuclease [Planctomycetota bacterium]
MSIKLNGYKKHVSDAVAHYWNTLTKQAENQSLDNRDHGHRSAVTGGKQMDGFCGMIAWLLKANGLDTASIYTSEKRVIPGYFRATKDWDLLVVDKGFLVAAIEFKSQRGPSFGNNLNNRAEEAVGVGHDFEIALREGAFKTRGPRPWVGWVMLLEDCDKVKSTVRVSEPHFDVFKEFKAASYAKRYELLLRRLVAEKLYDSAALLLASEQGGPRGKYTEPATDIGMHQFLAGLAGHVTAHLELGNDT